MDYAELSCTFLGNYMFRSISHLLTNNVAYPLIIANLQAVVFCLLNTVGTVTSNAAGGFTGCSVAESGLKSDVIILPL